MEKISDDLDLSESPRFESRRDFAEDCHWATLNELYVVTETTFEANLNWNPRYKNKLKRINNLVLATFFSVKMFVRNQRPLSPTRPQKSPFQPKK